MRTTLQAEWPRHASLAVVGNTPPGRTLIRASSFVVVYTEIRRSSFLKRDVDSEANQPLRKISTRLSVNLMTSPDDVTTESISSGSGIVSWDRFYYDFFSEENKMTDADLKRIKKEMDKIIRQKLPLVREEVTRYPHVSTAVSFQDNTGERKSLLSHWFGKRAWPG